MLSDSAGTGGNCGEAPSGGLGGDSADLGDRRVSSESWGFGIHTRKLPLLTFLSALRCATFLKSSHSEIEVDLYVLSPWWFQMSQAECGTKV